MYDENEVKKWLTQNRFESGTREGSIEKAVLDERNDVLEWILKHRPATQFTEQAVIDLAVSGNIEGLKFLGVSEMGRRILKSLSKEAVEAVRNSGNGKCIDWMYEHGYIKKPIVSVNEEIVKTVPVYDTTTSSTTKLSKKSASRVWSRTDIVDEVIKSKKEEVSLYEGFSSSIEEKLYNPDRYPLLSMCFQIKSDSDANHLTYDMYTLLMSKIRQFEQEGVYTKEDVVYMDECMISALLRNVCYGGL